MDEDEPPETAPEQREEGGGDGSAGVRGRPFAPGNPWRFQPGQSGNPNGRPAGVRAAFERAWRRTKEDVPQLAGLAEDPEELAARTVIVGMGSKDGRVRLASAKEALDRLHGRVPISVKLGPDIDEGPREIRIRVVSREDVVKPPLLPSGGNGDGPDYPDPSAAS